MNNETWKINEKIRTAYLEVHYEKVLPVANGLMVDAAYSSEQIKLFEGAIKKFEAVSKKMDETESKLKLLGEASGKLALTNNDANLKKLNDSVKAQVGTISKTSGTRKLGRIYLQGIYMKAIDDDFKELLRAATELQTDTDKNVKLNEGSIKDALKELTEGIVKNVKDELEDAKKNIQPPVANAPNDVDYNKFIKEMTDQIEA